MKKILLFSLLALFLFNISTLQAQSCFSVAAGNDTSISCLQPCLDLKARIPDIRSTETYSVISIPYTPYPYTTPGGITDPLVNADDNFSDSFKLPFPFCFYGNTYNQLCVGSNGVMTFDVVSNAKKAECYVINSSNTLFYSGGFPDDINTFYAPKASIFLAYFDLNPLTSPAGNKIEWRVEGTAPCRRFVVSYYHIGNYETGACPNPTNLCTMQAVLYEGSGIIDVFYENKPACAAATNGNGISIAGVQNWNQDQSVSPVGTNCLFWTAANQGIRYVPSGTTSLLDSVVLYKNNVRVTSDPAPVVLGNGELEATFSPVCQSEDSMSYVVRAFYRQCDNTSIQTEGSDTIIVYKTLNPIITKIDSARCKGGLGKITVTTPVGANIEYSINGSPTWQLSPVFNVVAGSYTINARVVASLCGGFTNVVVEEPTLITAGLVTTAASCANNDGVIDIIPGGGNPGYEYSINNGVNYQPLNQFLNLPIGSYNNIKVRDVYGCIGSFFATIALNDTMRLELGPDSTICFGSSITLIPQTNALTDTFKWTPIATPNDTVKNPIVTPNDTTKYYLTAKWGVCSRKDSIIINVKHKPVAYAGKDTTICYKTNATLFGSASNLSGTVNFAWSPPDSLNTPNAATTFVRVDTTRQFTLTVTDNYGCNFSVTDSVTVFMQPELVAFAGNDTNAILNRPHQLMATGRNAVDFVWSPIAPLNNPFIANPLAILNANTYFFVHITDAIGCTDDDTIYIKAYEGPTYYLPNAFTPNGDTRNDVFFPVPVGIRSTDYFRVFDRFGKLMYQTRQWMQGWDGTLKGKPAASGTYVWMIKGIDTNGSVVEMKGTVILIR